MLSIEVQSSTYVFPNYFEIVWQLEDIGQVYESEIDDGKGICISLYHHLLYRP